MNIYRKLKEQMVEIVITIAVALFMMVEGEGRGEYGGQWLYPAMIDFPFLMYGVLVAGGICINLEILQKYMETSNVLRCQKKQLWWGKLWRETTCKNSVYVGILYSAWYIKEILVTRRVIEKIEYLHIVSMMLCTIAIVTLVMAGTILLYLFVIKHIIPTFLIICVSGISISLVLDFFQVPVNDVAYIIGTYAIQKKHYLFYVHEMGAITGYVFVLLLYKLGSIWIKRYEFYGDEKRNDG